MNQIIDTESFKPVEKEKEVAGQRSSIRIRRGSKALISTANRILLVKEQHTDGSLFWTLPGGGVESDELLHEGLIRELFEELQCRSLIHDRVATIWYAHSSHQSLFSVYTVFDCSLLSTPDPNEKEGILEYRWASPSSLPSNTLPQVRHML